MAAMKTSSVYGSNENNQVNKESQQNQENRPFFYIYTLQHPGQQCMLIVKHNSIQVNSALAELCTSCLDIKHPGQQCMSGNIVELRTHFTSHLV